MDNYRNFKVGIGNSYLNLHEQLRYVYSESLNVQNIVDNQQVKIPSFSHELLNCDVLRRIQFQTWSHRFHN